MKPIPILLLALSVSTVAVASRADREQLAQATANQQNIATQKTKEWAVCLISNTRKYAVSSEAADLIVDAAMGECSQHEEPLRLALVGMHMRAYVGVAGSIASMVAASEADADRTLLSMRTGYRGKMIALVLEERIAASARPNN